ncbi:DUF6893 family small protein [Streptomyces sp. NPDC057638]
MVKSVAITAAATAVGVLLWQTLPDLKRYLRISRM